MSRRRAAQVSAVLSGAVAVIFLLLAACAPAARATRQAAREDATSTAPVIAPTAAPTPTPWPCAQGEAPPGHPLSWTFEERLRCFPPPSTPLNTPAPLDSSTLTRAPEERWVVLKGLRVPLPEGVRRTGGGIIDCARGQRCWETADFLVLYKGTSSLQPTAWVQIDLRDPNDPVLVREVLDPNDPAAFDFLKPYVRLPSPSEWASFGPNADPPPSW